jgi:hypothetical protein
MIRTAFAVAARFGAILAMVVMTGVAVPGMSSAGGPTSVLLASPSGDAAAGLYYSDPDYDALSTLLGDVTAGSETVSVDPPPATANAPYVTATWLIHDVSVWRIDRMFVLPGDEVWIVSQSSWDGTLTGEGMFPGETGHANSIWHAAADGPTLAALLSKYGLTTGSERPEVGELVPAAVDGAPIQATAAPMTVATASASEWIWAAAGLLAGLVVGGAVCWQVIGRRSGSPLADSGEPERMVHIP